MDREHTEAVDLEILALWRRPAGTLDPWVSAIIALAGMLTVAIAAIGARSWSINNYGTTGVSLFWLHNVLAIALGLWLAVSLIPPWRMSRWIRVAVLLPIAHALAMIVVWRLWGWLSERTAGSVQMILQRVSILPTIAIAAAQLLGGAWLVARRRRRSPMRGELGHAVVMLALVELLLFGLWLSIGSRVWCWLADVPSFHDVAVALDHPLSVSAFLILPPFAVALGFTAFALRKSVRAVTGSLMYAVVALFAIACILRFGGPEGPFLVYINYVHVLCVMAGLAVTSLAGLGVATWVRDRQARRAFASDLGRRIGVLVEGSAYIENTTWLRGPAPVVSELTVATRTGELRVPLGACWAAPMPAATTQLRTGEAVVALRTGDRVVVAGYLDREDASHPFRGSLVPVPGPGGILVARPGDEAYGLANIALTLWRPCVAYLVILIAIGAPALAGAVVYM